MHGEVGGSPQDEATHSVKGTAYSSNQKSVAE